MLTLVWTQSSAGMVACFVRYAHSTSHHTSAVRYQSISVVHTDKTKKPIIHKQMEEYYVYVYIDPRNFKKFYFGKGNRKNTHKFDKGDSEKEKWKRKSSLFTTQQIRVSLNNQISTLIFI